MALIVFATVETQLGDSGYYAKKGSDSSHRQDDRQETTCRGDRCQISVTNRSHGFDGELGRIEQGMFFEPTEADGAK